MQNEVVKSQNGLERNFQLSESDINTLVKAGIIPDKTPSDQIRVFAQICKERGLSPFSKEIYLVGYNGKYSVIVGINGFRRLATDTGSYAGCDDAKFDLCADGTFKSAADLLMENKLPITCTVTVYRIVGQMRVPFTHTAVFGEFNSKQGKWVSMPFQMIAKVAEAFALRKGFSDRLTGLSIEEERGAMEGNISTIEVTAPGQTIDDVMDTIRTQVRQCNSLNELLTFYRRNPQWVDNDEVTQIFTEYKIEKGWNKSK